jgi:hypothetical protein
MAIIELRGNVPAQRISSSRRKQSTRTENPQVSTIWISGDDIRYIAIAFQLPIEPKYFADAIYANCRIIRTFRRSVTEACQCQAATAEHVLFAAAESN